MTPQVAASTANRVAEIAAAAAATTAMSAHATAVWMVVLIGFAAFAFTSIQERCRKDERSQVWYGAVGKSD